MSDYDAVDGSHPTASQLLFLAISGLFGTVPQTSALPPKADIGGRAKESPARESCWPLGGAPALAIPLRKPIGANHPVRRISCHSSLAKRLPKLRIGGLHQRKPRPEPGQIKELRAHAQQQVPQTASRSWGRRCALRCLGRLHGRVELNALRRCCESPRRKSGQVTLTRTADPEA